MTFAPSKSFWCPALTTCIPACNPPTTSTTSARRVPRVTGTREAVLRLTATHRDKAPRLPEIVQIESTNLCNAKCVFCPRDEMHRRQGVMDMELFRKIVDECAALGITHVRVHNYGEPFLDRQLVEKVRYAKQQGIKEVGMISNGSLITEKIARGMVEAGLDATFRRSAVTDMIAGLCPTMRSKL